MVKSEIKKKYKKVAKVSALSSGKMDKYDYLTGEGTLPPQQNKIIKEPKFTDSLLKKAFQKQTTTIKKHQEKQVKTL